MRPLCTHATTARLTLRASVCCPSSPHHRLMPAKSIQPKPHLLEFPVHCCTRVHTPPKRHTKSRYEENYRPCEGVDRKSVHSLLLSVLTVEFIKRGHRKFPILSRMKHFVFTRSGGPQEELTSPNHIFAYNQNKPLFNSRNKQTSRLNNICTVLLVLTEPPLLTPHHTYNQKCHKHDVQNKQHRTSGPLLLLIGGWRGGRKLQTQNRQTDTCNYLMSAGCSSVLNVCSSMLNACTHGTRHTKAEET